MKEVLLFKIDKNLLGLDVENVESVEQNINLTLSNEISNEYIGMFTVRDEIINVLNLDKKLNCSSKTNNKAIVISNNNKKYGLIVDETVSIINTNDYKVNKLPKLINDPVFSGAIKVKDNLALIISTKELI